MTNDSLAAKRSEYLNDLLGAERRALTQNAMRGLEKAVDEHTEKLFSEAKSIESLDHHGPGAPEITGAHVEEAKWVLVRRLRRQQRHKGWLRIVRVVQVVAAGAVGFGFAEMPEPDAAYILAGSIFIAAVAALIEQNLARE